jgi:hypothetical protein
VVADQREAFDDIERSFMDKSKMTPKFKMDYFVLGANFGGWTRRIRLIMEARVHETTQLLMLLQALLDSLTEQFLDFRGDGIAQDVIVEHFAKLYMVDTDIESCSYKTFLKMNLRLSLVSIRDGCV